MARINYSRGKKNRIKSKKAKPMMMDMDAKEGMSALETIMAKKRAKRMARKRKMSGR